MTTRHILTGALIASLAVAAVLVYQRSDVAPPVVAPRISTPELVPEPQARPAAIAAARPVFSAPRGERPPAPAWDDTFVQFVMKKYRYLLADVRGDVNRAQVLQLLLEREHIVAGLPESKSRLAEIERALQALLPPANFTTFELLRESDDEQHHVGEYTGGISNFAPLTPEQERAILEAKMRHKRAFETALRDAGLERKSFSNAEREFAHAAVQQAIDEYRDGFLLEVQPLLNEDQHMLLSNYETTEFERELQRLQIEINSK